MEPEPQDPLRELSPTQELALEALLAGKTQVEAADAADVARETVNRWMKRHPGFIAAYRQRRQARATAAEEVAANLDRKAMEVVADAVGEGDTKTAIAWLRIRPKGQPEPSTEATTAEGVFDEMAKAEDTRLIAGAFSLRGYAESRGFDLPSTDVVRRLLEDDLRLEHGLTPLPDEVPHWSQRERVPCSWFVAAADETRAAERLRNFLNTGDSSHVTDVAPIGAEDIRELAELLNVPYAKHLPMPEHPCEGDRFRLMEIDDRIVASIARIANKYFDDAVGHWWDCGLSEDRSLGTKPGRFCIGERPRPWLEGVNSASWTAVATSHLIGTTRERSPPSGFGGRWLRPVASDEATVPTNNRCRFHDQQSTLLTTAVHGGGQNRQDRAVDLRETGSGNLTLQYEHLVTQSEDLCVTGVASCKHPPESAQHQPSKRGKQGHGAERYPPARCPCDRRAYEYSAPTASSASAPRLYLSADEFSAPSRPNCHRRRTT